MTGSRADAVAISGLASRGASCMRLIVSTASPIIGTTSMKATGAPQVSATRPPSSGATMPETASSV